MSQRFAWPPTRPATSRTERTVGVVGLVLIAFLYLFRLDAGSPLLKADNEQCKKWPTYQTERCFEMIPLDEIHYVPDARDVLRFGTESTTQVPTSDDGAFVVHPPVGKWLIAGGIAIFGDQPIGWRFFNALAGILGIWLCYSLARRMIGNVRWSMIAAGLLALDGLWFTMSRIAMLDIAAGVATLAAIRLTIEVVARAAEDRNRNRVRIATGFMWGISLATKWSVGSFALVAGLILLTAEAIAWLSRQRRPIPIEAVEVQVFGRDAIEAWADALAAQKPPPRSGSARAFAMTMVVMTILPSITYLATFAPWFANEKRYLPPRCEETTPLVAAWWCYQKEQLDFHKNLQKYELDADADATEDPTENATEIDEEPIAPTAKSTPAHPYFGHGVSWPWLGRPVVHAYRSPKINGTEHAREVMSVPNPISWWLAFFVAIPWLFVRSPRDRHARLLLALIAAGWLPYLLADLVARPVFLFYATPLVPILAVASASVLRRLWEGAQDHEPNPFARGIAIGLMIATVTAFAWLYPVYAAAPLPLDDLGWSARIWFSTDCTADTIKVLCWI